MEDQYIVLLERVIAENVRLREELEARDNEQKCILAELGAKIESSSNSGQERESRKRKRKTPVPQQCRVSIFLSWFPVNHDRLVCSVQKFGLFINFVPSTIREVVDDHVLSMAHRQSKLTTRNADVTLGLSGIVLQTVIYKGLYGM